MSEISIPQETVPTFASPQGFPENLQNYWANANRFKQLQEHLKLSNNVNWTIF